jgi:hypothetical protein
VMMLIARIEREPPREGREKRERERERDEE